MDTRRKGEAQVSRSQFRTDRLIKERGQWYFHTREGTIEGPFMTRTDATNQMEIYIRLANNKQLQRAFTLELEKV